MIDEDNWPYDEDHFDKKDNKKLSTMIKWSHRNLENELIDVQEKAECNEDRIEEVEEEIDYESRREKDRWESISRIAIISGVVSSMTILGLKIFDALALLIYFLMQLI